MPNEKKPSRRSQAKNPGLHPEFNPKSRADLVDYDYLDQLSDKEKEWLNSFTEEYTHANFNHPGKILHRTKRLKKDCYDRNNARNRCIWTRAKASGMSAGMDAVEAAEAPKEDPKKD